jgi:Protein of unknown function (DUF1003)
VDLHHYLRRHFVSWVLLNTFILARYSASFDPYPYILLNLFLSMLAAVQAPGNFDVAESSGIKRQAGCGSRLWGEFEGGA